MTVKTNQRQSELTRRVKSVCFGGGKIIGLVLSSLVLVLSFLNTVSARYLDTPCPLQNIPTGVQKTDTHSRAAFNQCMALSAELATRLHTHG